MTPCPDPGDRRPSSPTPGVPRSSSFSRPVGIGVPEPDSGPDLTAALLTLTVVTGLVDAVSYLALGHVFVANMTGNVVFLAFAAAGAQGFTIASSLLAVLAFLAGGLIGGRWIHSGAGRPGILLAGTTMAEAILMAASAGVFAIGAGESVVPYGLILMMAIAMGIQNATARHLGVPDLTTTVLTMTLTALASDSRLAGGGGGRPAPQPAAVGGSAGGAGAGGLLLWMKRGLTPPRPGPGPFHMFGSLV